MSWSALLILLLTGILMVSTEVLFYDNFDSGLEQWTIDGSSAVVSETTTITGSSIKLQDNTRIVLNVTILGFDNVVVSYSLAAGKLQANGYCLFEVSYDGVEWIEVLSLAKGQDNSQFYTGEYPIDSYHQILVRYRVEGNSADICFAEDMTVSGDLYVSEITAEETTETPKITTTVETTTVPPVSTTIDTTVETTVVPMSSSGLPTTFSDESSEDNTPSKIDLSEDINGNLSISNSVAKVLKSIRIFGSLEIESTTIKITSNMHILAGDDVNIEDSSLIVDITPSDIQKRSVELISSENGVIVGKFDTIEYNFQNQNDCEQISVKEEYSSKALNILISKEDSCSSTWIWVIIISSIVTVITAIIIFVSYLQVKEMQRQRKLRLERLSNYKVPEGVFD